MLGTLVNPNEAGLVGGTMDEIMLTQYVDRPTGSGYLRPDPENEI